MLCALTQEIKSECDQVITLLIAAMTLGEVTPKCLDRVVSAGEKLSAKVLCALLRDRGVPADYIDLSDVTSLPMNSVLDQSFYNGLATRLGAKVQTNDARVKVVTGFFGQVPGGLLHQVSRGYTDLCAVLLAAGIPGAQLQVWKELDGIFTADPRRVRAARLLRRISPAEAADLTFYGSEVIHPVAMKQATRSRILITVKGVM